jgi:putative membrane-bound dehydrogenase-like protein
VIRRLLISAAVVTASAAFLCFWPPGTSLAPGRATNLRGLDAITVPEGFQVELASAPGVVSYPMLGEFDDRGRLFLCESSGKTMKTPEMTADPNYQVTVLEDTDGDGVFDKSTVFADKLTLPAGAVWLEGSLYVAAPPDLLRLTDTDGDGRADKKEILVTGWNLSANAASLHGPILGPDGWLYLTDGRLQNSHPGGPPAGGQGVAHLASPS